MYNLWKKVLSLSQFKSNEEFEEISPRKQEITHVAVKDIKQYLVEEYDRAQELYKNNEYLKSELEKANQTKTKYDASLVMLEQNKSRMDMLERKIAEKDKEKQKLRNEIDSLRDELNNYKILFNRAAITREDITEEIIVVTKETIIQDIKNQKGTLGKQKICDIILKCDVKVGE